MLTGGLDGTRTSTWLRRIISVLIALLMLSLIWHGTDPASQLNPHTIASKVSTWSQRPGQNKGADPDALTNQPDPGDNLLSLAPDNSDIDTNSGSVDLNTPVADQAGPGLVDDGESALGDGPSMPGTPEGAPELVNSSYFPPLPPADEEEYMAICMTVKNQPNELDEFLRHHYHHHGVRRFYVHDDGSSPRLATQDYSIPGESLNWIWHDPVPHNAHAVDRAGIQESYYTHCAKRYAKRHVWMGFLDTDEFVEMTAGNETLAEFLHSWEKMPHVGAVGAQWIVHNSAGHKEKPTIDSRKAYDRCIIDNPANDNTHIKTFVRLSQFQKIWNVHCMAEFASPDVVQVGEHGDTLHTPCERRKPISHDRWILHHYATKSRADFEEKMSRGHIRGGGADEKWWRQIEDEKDYFCANLTLYNP